MATTRKTTTAKNGTAKKTAAKAGTQAKEPDSVPAPETSDAEIAALKAQLADMSAQLDAANKAKDETETLKAQVAELLARQEAAQKPQIITVAADTEKVQFLWQAEVADDNVTSFGDGGMYGRIIGKTGVIYVPKSDVSRILTAMNRYFLDTRQLIVVSGLTEEEREAWGVDYKEGEILDRTAFARMVELEGGILEIYPNLCEGHKEMVAKRYNEAYQAGNPHVKRDVVEALYRMAKEAGREEDFKGIVEAMNAAVTA